MNKNNCGHGYVAKIKHKDYTLHIKFRKDTKWNGLIVLHSEGYYFEIDVDYCPLCGEKLEVEEDGGESNEIDKLHYR